VGRGVLVDVAAHLGVPALTADASVGRDLLADACRARGVELAAGDIVLVRTGWLGRHGGDPGAYFDGEPGLDVDGAGWLAEHDVAAVGADNYAVEQLDARSSGGFPVHELLLRDFGIVLIEGLVLDGLASRGVHEFLFVAAPLPIRGGTASPVAPVAVI
jgi:kynurenine formamidase